MKRTGTLLAGLILAGGLLGVAAPTATAAPGPLAVTAPGEFQAAGCITHRRIGGKPICTPDKPKEVEPAPVPDQGGGDENCSPKFSGGEKPCPQTP